MDSEYVERKIMEIQERKINDGIVPNYSTYKELIRSISIDVNAVLNGMYKEGKIDVYILVDDKAISLQNHERT